VLDGGKREIDIEVWPAKVVGAGPFHGRDLADRGIRKPGKQLERNE
jgi:hypothetical protein